MHPSHLAATLLIVASSDFKLWLFRSILVNVELTSPAVCALTGGPTLETDVAAIKAAFVPVSHRIKIEAE